MSGREQREQRCGDVNAFSADGAGIQLEGGRYGIPCCPDVTTILTGVIRTGGQTSQIVSLHNMAEKCGKATFDQG